MYHEHNEIATLFSSPLPFPETPQGPGTFCDSKSSSTHTYFHDLRLQDWWRWGQTGLKTCFSSSPVLTCPSRPFAPQCPIPGSGMTEIRRTFSLFHQSPQNQGTLPNHRKFSHCLGRAVLEQKMNIFLDIVNLHPKKTGCFSGMFIKLPCSAHFL